MMISHFTTSQTHFLTFLWGKFKWIILLFMQPGNMDEISEEIFNAAQEFEINKTCN